MIKDGATRHKRVGARLGHLDDRLGVDPAVDFDTEVEVLMAGRLGRPGDLLDGYRHEMLPAEAGMNRHHQQQVDLRQPGFARLERGFGVDGEADSEARWRMASIRARVSSTSTCTLQWLAPAAAKASRYWPGIGHHQMAIKIGSVWRRMAATTGGSDGQVGHEVAVHDIHVQPVRFGPDPVDLGAERGEVGRKDRRGDPDHRFTLPGRDPEAEEVHPVGVGRLRNQPGPPAGSLPGRPGARERLRAGSVRASQPSTSRVSARVRVHTLYTSTPPGRTRGTAAARSRR